jgi:hypothetical protein
MMFPMMYGPIPERTIPTQCRHFFCDLVLEYIEDVFNTPLDAKRSDIPEIELCRTGG